MLPILNYERLQTKINLKFQIRVQNENERELKSENREFFF